MVYEFPNFNWKNLEGTLLRSIKEEDGIIEIILRGTFSDDKFFIRFKGCQFQSSSVKLEDVVMAISYNTAIGFVPLTKLIERGENPDEYMSLTIHFSGPAKEIMCAVQDLKILAL